MVFAILYMVLGYWAAGKTVYANYVMIGTMRGIFGKKMATGLLLGWILIPVAIIKTIFGR